MRLQYPAVYANKRLLYETETYGERIPAGAGTPRDFALIE